MGVVGTAGNALILYALVVSKQHKKHPMIVNQNALDFLCSFALIVSVAAKLSNIRYIGKVGYWLCVTLYSEMFVSYGMYGSRINIAVITVERYLKVVHPVCSKKKLRSWMITATMTFCWLIRIMFVTFAFKESRIGNGTCYYVASRKTQMGLVIWYMLSFYAIIFALFVFCYGRILMTIRRQVKVMAAHSASAGPSTAQTQSKQIQTNVIKTMITDNTVRQINISQGNVATQQSAGTLCKTPNIHSTLVKQISISRGSVATRSSAGTNVIKTMILVSAFYVICHLLQAVLYIDMTVGTNRLAGVNYVACISRFIQFLYVTTNPFIYAIKFDPVRKVLKEMISRRTRRNVVMSHPGASASRMTAV